MYIDPVSKSEIPLEDALEAGMINLPQRKSSITSADRIPTCSLQRTPSQSRDSSPASVSSTTMTLKEPVVKEIKKIIVNTDSPETTNAQQLLLPVDIDKASENEIKQLISPDVIVIDPKTGKDVPLRDITKDIDKIQVKDPHTGKKISLKEGAKLGLLAVVGAPVLAGMAAVDAAKKLMKDSKKETPKQIIEIASQIRKPVEIEPEKEVEVEKDEETIKEELKAEYSKPYPLQVAVALGNYNKDTGLLKLNDTDEFLTINEAIERNEVDGNALTCRDPRSGSIVSLNQAISAGLIQEKTGQAIDPKSGAEINLDQAIDSGLLLAPTRKSSLTELIYNGKYDSSSNTITIETGEEITLKDAIENDRISTDSVVVQDPSSNKLVPFKSAVKDGILNLNDGLVKVSEKEKLNISEALENGNIVETKIPLSLGESILKGLYDKENKLFLEPKSGKYLNLSEALEKNIIDSDACHVKDTREGFIEKKSLKAAIEEKFVDGEDGSVKDFKKNVSLSLVDALNSGLIVDSRMPISLQKALHSGLYDEESGKLIDPNTGNKIKLHEGIRRLVVNPSLPCYWDEESSKVLSLVETCRAGIINRQKGQFIVQSTKEKESKVKLGLLQALKEEFILDIEKSFGLYKAVKIGLYDQESGKFVHPSTGARLTLEDSIKEDLIDPNNSIVKHESTLKIMKLNEAIEQKLINPIQGVYNIPNSSKVLTLDEARRKGLILTTERPLSLLDAVNENLYNSENGKIADTLTTTWMNLAQAIENDVIQSKSSAIQNLQNRKIKSIISAIDDGEINVDKGVVIDSNKSLSFDRAVAKGMIIKVDSAISFGDAVKGNAIDFRRGTFVDPRTVQTSSLHEAIWHELIEQGSVVVKHPIDGNYRTVREAIKIGLVDLNKRALVDPESRKLKPLCLLFEQGSIIYLRESITFDKARDSGLLNVTTGKFSDPTNGIEDPISIKEAIDIGAIDGNSAVVKDTLKKRLVKLPEAFTSGIIDSDKSTIYDTATNHIVPLNSAIEKEIIVTPRSPFGVIPALDYSLYDSSSGKFLNPYSEDSKGNRFLTLNESLASGLLEPNTTVVKEPMTGRIIPLTSAIAENIIDGEQGFMITDPLTQSKQNLLDAYKNGYLKSAEARLAIEAQYRTCSESITNLLDWISEVEKRLASQETLRETVEELKRQTQIVKQIKDDVDDKSTLVMTCLDQIRLLVQTGGEVLSTEKISTLERNGKTLKTRFDRVNDQSEKLYRKLSSACDELKKYKSEITTFKTWMDKSFRILEEKERNISNLSMSGRDNTKEFISDIISHQGDLRFITMSGQKFIDESRDYLQTLNEFRTNLPQRLSFLEAKESSIKHEVTHTSTMYQDLLTRAKILDDKLSQLGSKQKDFQDAMNRALAFLKEVTPRVQKSINEPIASEPKQIEEQLSRAKTLHNEILANGRLIDAVKQAASALLASDDSLTQAERSAVEKATQELENKYQNLLDRMKEWQDKLKERMTFLDLMKEFLDNHDNLNNWLAAKEKMMGVLGPISSDPRLVATQMQQVHVLRDEFRQQKPTLDSFNNCGDKILTHTTPNSPDGRKVEAKLEDINSKWNALLHRLDDRENSLDAAGGLSSDFFNNLNKLQDNLHKISDDLDDLIASKDDADRKLAKISEIARNLDSQRPVLANVEASGQQLMDILQDPMAKSDIKQKLGQVVRLFNQCQKKLDNCKAELENSRKDGIEFGNACDAANNWINDLLAQMADKLLVSADRDLLFRQIAEFEPLYKEVMSKEHEIIMTLNKGRDMLSSKSTSKSDHRNIQLNMEKIQRGWDKLKNEVSARNTRLQTCVEHLRKYDKARDSFMKWLVSAEDKMDTFHLKAFKKVDIDKQLKDLQAFKNDVWRHASEYESCKNYGETFLTSCDRDKDGIKSELQDMKERFDGLNANLLSKIQELEDAAAKLGEFNENCRGAKASLAGLGDKLASTTGNDPSKIKQLQDEAKKLERPLELIRNQGEGLCRAAVGHNCDDQPIRSAVDELLDAFDDLNSKLNDKYGDLENAKRLMNEFQNQMKSIATEIGNLENELNSMKPIGRDIPTVRGQIKELENFAGRLADKKADLQTAATQLENLIRQGIAHDPKSSKDQIDNLKRQISSIETKVKQRGQELSATLAKLEGFYANYNKTNEEIDELIRQEKSFGKSIGGDVASIKAQQQQLREFKTRHLEAVGRSVNDINKVGGNLIQSAATGVNTTGLEKDLEKMNDKFNSLKDRINEQERKLDAALLGAGKFKDGLSGIDKWPKEMEDLVKQQKPPSADYQVVKAQAHEQKFLNKMLNDRKPQIESLYKLGKELAKDAPPEEAREINNQIEDMSDRYNDLVDGAKDRQALLDEAMRVAKDWADKFSGLENWLDKTGKKLKDMSIIPTDEDKISKLIRDHDQLHDQILSKQPDFNQLADIAANLMNLVGDEDANLVADKLQDVTDRYGQLVEDSEALGNLLKQSKAALRHLVLSYEELSKWMDMIEKQLAKHKVIAVHTDKLFEQMDQIATITEEIKSREKQVDDTIESGMQLMSSISSEEAMQLKSKLDSLNRRFNDITTKAADLLKKCQDALPLVQQFHECHNNLSEWMSETERELQTLENATLQAQEKIISRLENEIPEEKKVLEAINLIGPQLCQLSPGEGANTIEALVTRDNRRFDAICEQVQRRSAAIQLAKARSMEVLCDIDELLDYFREIEAQLKDAEKPSCEPEIVRVQLSEHRALNDEISQQKGKARDVLATAKKVLREAIQSEDTATLREKAEDLKETMESVSKLSSDRLSALEMTLPLAEMFFQTHIDLNNWFDRMEEEMVVLDTPAIRPDQIMRLQEKTQAFIQAVNEHRPLLEKLNKAGEALVKLCNNDDGNRVQEIVAHDNDRYNSLKAALREKQAQLEKALQESSEFGNRLDGMLSALENTADQCNNMEPVAAYPEKILEQIDENQAIIDDVKGREQAYNQVKKQAGDVISKGNPSDPAIRDIRQKLDRLNSLWDQIQKATKNRGKNLDEALALAKKFWEQLKAIMQKLEQIQDNLKNQEPPGVEPKVIQEQQNALQLIKKDIDKAKPQVGDCREAGKNLMKVIGDQDKPEIQRNIKDLDSAWDNITALFAKRELNLIDAMNAAMEFSETLQALLKFLEKAEQKLASFDTIGTGIEQVKKQIEELKGFKDQVDPMSLKVESLNRQAEELTQRSTPQEAQKIKGPLAQVNRRWENLLQGIIDRQRKLEQALLRLGQFQTALSELLAWIALANKNVDSIKPVFGDPQVIEQELSKLKVLQNDIHSKQNSVDTLNDAGRSIIESERGTENAKKTSDKLQDLNGKWDNLKSKASSKQAELESALKEAQAFAAEIQDLLLWLNDIDGALNTSKPVGGLPETAKEQLVKFMEIYNEIEANASKVESVLQQGDAYLKRSTEGAATNLQHNLRTLRQRWESVRTRANDKKIKLEIALAEAMSFHEAVQQFIDWLTGAERYLTQLEPVSRILDKVIEQVESHKGFQKEVSEKREAMLQLEKQGNHLKYFSQKQDVILIKNLLISVQHRFDRVVQKSTERTRALDIGLKEAKEFNDNWHSLMQWLGEAEKTLDEMVTTAANNPVKIKQMLAKHKEFQRVLASKQPAYDNTMKMGKGLKEKAPKSDDALQELLDWLRNIDNLLVADEKVHGDLDTVLALIEKHKKLESEVDQRRNQMNEIVRTAEEIIETAPADEKLKLTAQIREIKSKFDNIKGKCDNKSRRLEEALKEAEKLLKQVHMLLEWLSDAEMKLRFAGSLPDDEEGTRKLLEEHEKFMRELAAKEIEKNDTIQLAKSILAKAHPDAVPIIKHWISIIETRFEEISNWALQRHEKLKAHLASIQNAEELLSELMAWLQRCEDTLVQLEQEPLPDDLSEIQVLIKEHKEFMENMAKRQPEIDSVCKPKLISRPSIQKGRAGRLRSSTPGSESRETSPELDMAQRRLSARGVPGSRETTPSMSRMESPGREKTPDLFPHIGPSFGRRGSKAVEPQIKDPKVKALWDKWKHVWILAWERQRRLQDKYNYLLELEKVKNFSWQDWAKRFLQYNHHKKSRVTDIFRKVDKNNDCLIPREVFIDAIVKTKFPTSRLEMNAVADMFDHGDHMIDYMEFIAALRPDWEEKKPVADTDIIDDEVQRQVARCTCRQKFRVFQIGEGKYRFGDSQKLRLVRILRSTVMVRVGGGWQSLDEFLVKNDPCRAKGRTNIELREKFILADGVSQTMTAFKSKTSGGSTMSSEGRSAQSLPTAGPITKVKERSIRSVPMAGGRARSTDRTTPESQYSDDFSMSRLPRKSSAGRGSQPGSRPGSKPPSRAGSNVSLDSTDDRSGIPVRRSASLKRGSSGYGSSRPLATSTPLSSRALSFTRPSTVQRPSMQRTGSSSSIHSLSGGRPSRIPVFVGEGGSGADLSLNGSRSRTPSHSNTPSRTPSSSNIPIAVQQSTSRTRTPSGSNVSFSLTGVSSSGARTRPEDE